MLFCCRECVVRLMWSFLVSVLFSLHSLPPPLFLRVRLWRGAVTRFFFVFVCVWPCVLSRRKKEKLKKACSPVYLLCDGFTCTAQKPEKADAKNGFTVVSSWCSSLSCYASGKHYPSLFCLVRPDEVLMK